ncbi:hypothetical protein A9Q84_14075 [Halobacteriovorax marinus]|uniref:Activator of Hsp90 ATPase homologue 1/2-like C-terminal domain-containing protein n=1 Tax=Halobacteriovorax marinus TaxID=97084 RepID=A0A1Y5F4N1_9BACT|nr:hypothetical protein A9Q84_14075 [Halobacteriovorax marinus]
MSETLTVEKRFKANVQTVYEAWTDPSVFPQWMGPGEVTCIKFESDFSIGGQYEIHMQTEDGVKIAFGEYKEILPNEKLSFTWGWKGTELEGTLVELTFKSVEDETSLTLVHSGLPTKESAEHHTLGWNSSIDKLENFLNQ